MEKQKKYAPRRTRALRRRGFVADGDCPGSSCREGEFVLRRRAGVCQNGTWLRFARTTWGVVWGALAWFGVVWGALETWGRGGAEKRASGGLVLRAHMGPPYRGAV